MEATSYKLVGFDQVFLLDKCLKARARWLEKVLQFLISPVKFVCVIKQQISPGLPLCWTEEKKKSKE